VAATETGAQAQWQAVQSTGNQAIFVATPAARAWQQGLKTAGAGQLPAFIEEAQLDETGFEAVLFEGDADALRVLNRRIAARPGPILTVQGLTSDALAAGASYLPDRLLNECSISTNTAAAGGNASLMSIG